MARLLIAAPVLAVALLAAVPSAPAGPPKDLAEQVRVAIRRGVQFLRDQENGGKWEIDPEALAYRGGQTSLVVLALLTAGVPPEDPAVQDGLKYLRGLNPDKTYVVGLQTMAFVQAGYGIDRGHIQDNVNWLLKARKGEGWTYVMGGGTTPDFSNTQYALLGLHEGIRAGARVPPEDLQQIQKLYLTSRTPDHGWGYHAAHGTGNARMTMTAAGVCGLVITGMDLHAGDHPLDPDGSDPSCGKYKDTAVTEGLRWIGDRFPARLDNNNALSLGTPYYCLYGLERAGRLTGQRYFGDHDWYRVGCEWLVEAQAKGDGSWQSRLGGQDGGPIVSTCFALLFLSKGRTPVLVTKLAYGSFGWEGWNNKRSDARHLVEFAGRELFKNQSMAWQVVDLRNQDPTAERVHDLAAELLQSPLVYLNGHDARLQPRDLKVLKDYVENGGTVLAEACCNRDQFVKDFHKLVGEITPGGTLEPLDPTHQIYHGRFDMSPKEFPLEGVSYGCRTAIIFSPRALSGYWENDESKAGRGRKAFELGANVIAYASGLEPPKPRLSTTEVFRGDDRREEVRRGFLKVGQLQYARDSKPAPRAMRNLMTEGRGLGLDVVLQTDDIDPTSEKVLDYRFLYMHGRRKFTVDVDRLKHLKFVLKSGGLLFADACCGSRDFDESFREMMSRMWSGEKGPPKLEPIPQDDELYGRGLTGSPITTVRCRREGPDGKRPEPEYREVAPALEGVKINGRWAVIYSRYDIGCALEKNRSTDCLGYDYPSAVLLGKAAMFYALKR